MEIKNAIMTKNPCYTSGRTIRVRGLMLHSVGCPQPSASVFYNSWNRSDYTSACVHAFIDANTGDVWQTLPWDRRGWHCGGSGNDSHIGVEMCEPETLRYISGSSFSCSDLGRARTQVRTTYNSAVLLFAKLCKIYGLDPTADGTIVSHKEGYRRGIATNHGDPEHLWSGLGLGYTMDGFRRDVAAAMGSAPTVIVEEPAGQGTTEATAIGLYGRSNAEIVKVLGELAREDAKESGILASITCAQAILESGYARSELAIQANNLFGMKTRLSGNTWPGSTWDGSSVYSKTTVEVDEYGIVAEEVADFRRYPYIRKSIADRSAYLLGAKNGKKLRYKGLKGEKDFAKAAGILLTGGYATDPSYAAKLQSVRDQWGLAALDAADDIQSQATQEDTSAPKDVPFLVKVTITDLRIRTGPGVQYDFTQYIPVGVYTIVEVRGSWGKLKSGAGWICLDYVSTIG